MWCYSLVNLVNYYCLFKGWNAVGKYIFIFRKSSDWLGTERRVWDWVDRGGHQSQTSWNSKKADFYVLFLFHFQVYKGLDIVTNKVTEQEQMGVRHHLLGFLEPHETLRAPEFRNMALDVVSFFRFYRRCIGGVVKRRNQQVGNQTKATRWWEIKARSQVYVTVYFSCKRGLSLFLLSSKPTNVSHEYAFHSLSRRRTGSRG